MIAQQKINDGPLPDLSTPEALASEKAYRSGYLLGARAATTANWPASEEITAALNTRFDDRVTGDQVVISQSRGFAQAFQAAEQGWLADMEDFPANVARWIEDVEGWASGEITRVSMPPRFEIEGPVEPAEPEAIVEAPAKRQYTLTRIDELKIRPPDWLLHGTLERDTLAMLFGAPGCGKSFLALDMAARVATGTPWRGRDVNSAPVVYIAAEGRHGLGRRRQAWEKHNGVSLAGAPLYIGPALALTNGEQLSGMLAALDAEGHKPALIVVDTLARCFGAGDENSTRDMSRFVAACDLIRQRYGCTILLVHHVGHLDKNRARGAAALTAALDAEYRLTSNSGLLLTSTKMKDAEPPDPLAMELVQVDLPGLVDEYGNPITSAAVEVVDADTSAIVAKAQSIPTASSGRWGKWQKVGLQIAKRLSAASKDGWVSVKEWRAECETAGMSRATLYRVVGELEEREAIATEDDFLVVR